MEAIFFAIDYKDPIWITIAFLFGALSRIVGLPPLAGYLLAGFLLNYAGMQGGVFLNELADLGVTLLLFTIGLKLNLGKLLRLEVWGTTLAHMLLFGGMTFLYLLIFRKIGFSLFEQLTLVQMLIISFALSFSSTVFVVKTLEDKGSFLSKYGQIAIGILIIQDLVAVVYLGVSEAKIPSLWAVALIITIFILRPFIIKLSIKIGHGELLLLFGLSMAMGGASLFEAVDMKADLGALSFGALLANTPKADELSKALFGVKELFLLGFFLSIGMAGLPDATTFVATAAVLVLLLVKSGLFLVLLSNFKVPIYTAGKTAMSLGNFSEFGLIVIIVAVSQRWIASDWLIVMALLVAVSFVISSVVNKRFDDTYCKYRAHFQKYQESGQDGNQSGIDLRGVQVIICGMGRVGSGAFAHLKDQKNVIGLDFDEQVVEEQIALDFNTYHANTSSSEFWRQNNIEQSQVEWILLCAPNIETNKTTARLARVEGFTGVISAISKYQDEEQELVESGVDSVWNIYAEAGAGLALHGRQILMKDH